MDDLVSAALARHPSFGFHRPGRPALLIGLAGTVSALTMLALGLDSYDRAAVHHARLARAEVPAFSVSWRRWIRLHVGRDGHGA